MDICSNNTNCCCCCGSYT